MTINLVFIFFLLACCGYGLWQGGGPERITAIILMLAVVFTHLETSVRYWSSVEVGILIVDGVTVLALLIVALRAERFWPLWVVALQIIGTAAHVMKLADPDIMRRAYAFALAFWSYPILALLVLGTYRHQQRLKRFGVDKSWSNFSTPSEPAPSAGPTA